MEYVAVALWLVAFLAMLALGLPLAAWLFPGLGDRGASVALPLVVFAIFLTGYYLGHLSLWVAAVATPLGLLGLSALAIRRGVAVDVRAYLEIAAVFALAFLVMVVMRAADPAIIPLGGEKFLDFGLLKALLRADAVPPEDFWYAGEPMMYYYGGHLVVAQLVRLLGTTPSVAYNLAVAGVFATVVSTAYGLAGNVAGRDGRFGRRAALLGGFFVGFASNLFTPLRVALRPLPGDLATSLAKTMDVWVGRVDRPGAVVLDLDRFHYWDATGVVDASGGDVTYISEFPFFAFVNGDLHAHMMAPILTLLGVTVLYAVWRLPPGAVRRRRALLFGLLPLVAGALVVVNTWSFPTIGGLAFLTVLFGEDLPGSLLPARFRRWVDRAGMGRRELARATVALASAFAVAALGVLWSLPFWLANVSGRSPGLFPDRIALNELVVVHGGFLVPIVCYFAYLAWVRYEPSWPTVVGLSGVWLVFIALTAAVDLAVVGVLAPLLLGGYVLGRRLWSPTDSAEADDRLASLPGFEVVLVLGALGLVFLVEFVYVQERAAYLRFNTIFKVYAQVWLLFSVGVAVALSRLLDNAERASPLPRWPTLLRGGIAVLVVALSIYGVVVAGDRAGDALNRPGGATLDGTAHLEAAHPEEAAAIEWLDDREGTPTVLTKPGQVYQWAGGPSALTGLPTLIAWQYHEYGWGRDWGPIRQRVADAEAIYTGDPATQRRLLAEYDVAYVYVGPLEREAYGDRLSIGELAGVDPAATFEGVTIYAVDASLRDGDGS